MNPQKNTIPLIQEKFYYGEEETNDTYKHCKPAKSVKMGTSRSESH